MIYFVTAITIQMPITIVTKCKGRVLLIRLSCICYQHLHVLVNLVSHVCENAKPKKHMSINETLLVLMAYLNYSQLSLNIGHKI